MGLWQQLIYGAPSKRMWGATSPSDPSTMSLFPSQHIPTMQNIARRRNIGKDSLAPQNNKKDGHDMTIEHISITCFAWGDRSALMQRTNQFSKWGSRVCSTYLAITAADLVPQ